MWRHLGLDFVEYGLYKFSYCMYPWLLLGSQAFVYCGRNDGIRHLSVSLCNPFDGAVSAG